MAKGNMECVKAHSTKMQYAHKVLAELDLRLEALKNCLLQIYCRG